MYLGPPIRHDLRSDAALQWSQRLKQRICTSVVPRLTEALLVDRKQRLRRKPGPKGAERREVVEAAVTLLYRLLFVSYAEARELLPIRNAAYRRVSLMSLQSEIAAAAGAGNYSDSEAGLYDRLQSLFVAIGRGDAALNLPALGGGLFTSESRIGGYLVQHKVSDRHLALAIDELARDVDPVTTSLTPIDYGSLEVRLLGSIYEGLLECDRPQRKASGSFYTPAAIVQYIVAQTIGPVLNDKLELLRAKCAQAHKSNGSERAEGELALQLLDFRVLDPAMGSGHFLVEGADFITVQLQKFLSQFPVNPLERWLKNQRRRALQALAEQGVAFDPEKLTDFNLLKRQALRHCIYGIDLDPLAVELAKICLWLDAHAPGEPLSTMDDHLRCADALLGASVDEQGFDAVVCNPPYGAALDRQTRSRLAKLLPQMKHNSDTAVGFIERAAQLSKRTAAFGFIVPKPLTYSFAWRHLREFLAGRIRLLADVSRAWPEVLLEQVILVGSAVATERSHYATVRPSGSDFQPLCQMPWKTAQRYQTLPCNLTAGEQSVLEDLLLSNETLGALCRTFRGRPWQRLLSASGDVPVIGGRDLARWHVRSQSGYIDDTRAADLQDFRQPKLLVQNIVAHIENPLPHIRIIGALDESGLATLDTVNNIVLRRSGPDLSAVLALLHSEFLNWFVYAVVYNKAIRTMHFDQYFLDKIPLPVNYQELLSELTPLARQVIESTSRIAANNNHLADDIEALPAQRQSQAASQQQIDAVVLRYYGLAPERFRRHCVHGSQ